MRPETGNPDDPRRWITYARSDFFIAENKLEDTLFATHGYHAQQCVEKCLKAVCLHTGVDFPYTHDLAELVEVLFVKGNLKRPEWAEQAKELTTYAVSGRYPGFDEPVTEDEWREAVHIAKTVLEWTEEIIR